MIISGKYVSGAWKVCCDVCGFEYLNTNLRQQWNGLRACSGSETNDCWSVRPPQELVRGRKDNRTPPQLRPEPPDLDVSPGSGNEITTGDL